MESMNCTYEEEKHPDTNEAIWIVEDISLPLGGVIELLEKFISQHTHPDYNLLIVDSLTTEATQIDCDINEIPKIVDCIYHHEKSKPLTFVGENRDMSCYVVVMPFFRGRIESGHYKSENGKLIKVE